MTAAPITGGIATDPYLASEPAPSWRCLHHLNPLAKLAAPILPIIALLFVRDIATPAALIALTYLILLTGQRLSRGLLLLLLLAPFAIALLAVGLALWTDPGTLESVGEPVVSIGSWHLYSGALVAGLASSLRLSAMLILALICGAATTGPDMVRSAVQHLHLRIASGTPRSPPIVSSRGSVTSSASSVPPTACAAAMPAPGHVRHSSAAGATCCP